MTACYQILPCKGRWQAEGLTEGCPPFDGATPLRRTDALYLHLTQRLVFRGV
jgi:hypothetical protein